MEKDPCKTLESEFKIESSSPATRSKLTNPKLIKGLRNTKFKKKALNLKIKDF